MMKRAIATLVLLAMAGCSDAPSETPALRVQLNWFPEPQFGGIYEAERSGLFEAAGLEVELLKGGPGVPGPQMVASGTVEFAIVSAPQLLSLRAQGGEATAVFATFQRYLRGLLVRDDAPYRSLEDLWKSDATVMVEEGLTYLHWLDRAYRGKNLSFVPYSGSMAPFLEGSVQAMQVFATAEPIQLSLEGVKTRMFLVADTGYDPYVSVIAVNDAFLKAHPERVSAFVSALRAGWTAYLADPTATNALIGSLNSDMSPEVLAKSAVVQAAFLESDLTRQKGLGWMDGARWKTLIEQLTSMDELRSTDRAALGAVYRNLPEAE